MSEQTQPEKGQEPTALVTDGYTAGQAAEIMSRNSGGRRVSPDLVKKLAQNGVIRSTKINRSLNIYNKEDVENYIVEARGTKVGRAAQARAAARRTEKTGVNASDGGQ